MQSDEGITECQQQDRALCFASASWQLSLARLYPSTNSRIIDSSGHLVLSRTTATLPQGIQLLRWDGTDDQGRALPNGVYFYRIEDGAQYGQGKLTVDR